MSLPDFTLSGRTAEFRDPAAEARYRRHIQAPMARHCGIAVLVPVPFLLLYSINDYLANGLDPEFWLLAACRLFYALTAIGAAILLQFRPALAPDGRLVTAVEALLFSIIILIAIARPEAMLWHAMMVAVMVVSIYLFAPNRVIYMAAIGMGASSAFVLAAMLLIESSWLLFLRLSLLLAAANTTGLLAAYRLSVLQRKEFALLTSADNANQRLAATNQQLLAEVRERRRLEAQLKELAATDPLTGLYNRRHFLELAGQALREARRSGQPLTVALLDLDHFKAVNDRHGHAGGDQALRAVAAACRTALREADLVGRFGGEEFMLCLPDTDETAAHELGERLRRTIAELRIDTAQGPLQVTATIGFAQCDPAEADLQAALRRADEALYAGKRTSRNCVVAAGPAVPLLTEQPT